MKLWLTVISAGLILWWVVSDPSERRLALESSETATAHPQRGIAAAPAASRAAFAPKANQVTTRKTPSKVSGTRIERLEQCLRTQDCAFPQTDPRSYEIAVVQALKEELAAFRRSYTSSPESDVLAEDLARRFVRSGDGFLQMEALALFALLPVSEANLTALTEGLRNVPDPIVIERSALELQRYLGTPWEPSVHTFLSETLTTGAHLSSATLAEHIFPFLTPESVPVYERTLKSLPAGTLTQQTLNWALTEYAKLRTGA